jgi:enterochelin esterase-like enzyme
MIDVRRAAAARRSRFVLAAVLATLTVTVAAARLAAAGPQLQGRLVAGAFASAAGRLAFDVYLPPGYDSTGERYPVIYYLHGLPAAASSYHGFVYVAQALEQAKLAAIVVAPQAARASEPDPEYLNEGPGREWETAIAVQLPALIDASYRTIASRSGRALVGVSAGGYGAMLLGLHHLARFAAIESWSGYFHPTDPTGTRSISSRPWLSAHAFVPSLRRAFRVHPTFLGFYVGAQDTLFRPENVRFARELSRAGVPFFFRIYPGGHSQTLWTNEAPTWLTMLLAQLSRPTSE